MGRIHKRFEYLRKVRKFKDVTSLTFASSKSLWEGYAFLVADYYFNEYELNTKYLLAKLTEFNKAKKFNKLQKDEVAVIVSLQKLRSCIRENKKDSTVDFFWANIPRDYFPVKGTENVYQILINESDEMTGHSISYLLDLYNLLVSFIIDKQTRMNLYSAFKEETIKVKRYDEHPLVLNEKIIKSLISETYLFDDFKKKKKYWE